MSPEEFISEQIEPDCHAMTTKAALQGGPALPQRFRWRGREYEIAAVFSQWKEDGPCHSGSGERYLRKHWYHIIITCGCEMKIYFERHPRSRVQNNKRWWLYTQRV